MTAATTLARWAREHRRNWSDVPLDVPVPVRQIVATPYIEEAPVPEPVALFEQPVAILEQYEPVAEPAIFEDVLPAPSMFERAWALAKSCTAAIGGTAGQFAVVSVEWLEPLRESAMLWLVRGVALAAVVSVAGAIFVNRGLLFERWDKMSSAVVAAANRPPIPVPPPPKPIKAGTGRITINSTNGEAVVFVDGTVHGPAPVTIDLPAGAHRLLLKGQGGSVERAMRITAGEATEMNEGIYPGWVAVAAPVELTLSERGQALKRDERGWAILPPGPHEIHLDNNALGVHEVRRVVVTPGDTTRLSFTPHTSTISLTTNEVADVWIDGKPYGQAPLVDQPLSIGVHDVRVRSAAHERWLRVRATTQPVTVNVDLTASR